MDNNKNVNTTAEKDAFDSFLSRESNAEKAKKAPKKKKKLKPLAFIIIGLVAVLIITGAIITLNLLPSDPDAEEDIDYGSDISLSVNEKGEHQAELKLNEEGELDNNSYGTLIEYTPSQITKIEVENESGSFTVLAENKTVTNEETGEEDSTATVYTLVGFEGIEMQTGTPDAVANDVSTINFTSVADPTGENISDFGFDSPRAIIVTYFSDDTTSTIKVGDDAPSQLGTYVMFGDSPAVYVVDSEAVDSFLYSVRDLVTLNINEAAADTDTSEFESLTISGTNFDSEIELKPNNDSAIDSSYVMIKPKNMFVSEVEAANISGAIRGLYADEVVCVNPSSSQLESYGLSSPYAQLKATYPDTTVNLRTSAPKDDSVYIMADTDIIYKISVDSIPWINTNLTKLTPDIVIDPNFSALTKIVVTDNSGTYNFDVTTITESVENTDGVTEEVEVTTAKYKNKTLDSDNFRVFYQNIANMQNAGTANDTPSGTPTLTIKLSYSTGRDTDVINVYETGNTKYIATLNGDIQCLVYKSYCTKFSKCVQDLIKGNIVSSF